MGATANAGTPIPAIPFASLPAAVPLDGSGSTPGAGAIDQYAWQIVSAPTGSTAALSSSSVAAPTLNGVNQAGAIILALNVHDTVDGWAWDPDPASGALQNLPNTMPSAIIVVNAELNYTGLVPVGLGERTTQDLTSADPGYQNAWGKLYALWNAVDGLQGEVDAIGSSPTFDAIWVDEINEKTAAHGIYLNDEVFAWDTVNIATGKGLVANAISAHVGQDLTLSSGGDLSAQATGALELGGLSALITAGVANSVTVRGGPLYPDLAVNVIGEDTAGSGVTIDGVLCKDGDVTTATSTDKVKTNIIEAGAVSGGITTLGISAAADISIQGGVGGVTVEAVNFDNTTMAGVNAINSAAASAMTVFAYDTMSVGSTNKALLQSNAGDSEVKATLGNVVLTASAGDINATAGDDITLTATDDFSIGAGGATGFALDGGAQTALISAPNGIQFANKITTPSGDLSIEPASGYVSVTGVVLSDTIETAIFPLAVKPGSDFVPAAIVGPYNGVIDSCYFSAAVAATSAAGDITVAVYDGGDIELVAPTSIDGVTSTNPTISLADYGGGFYVQVSSDNADAVQGYGLTLTIGYKRQAP